MFAGGVQTIVQRRLSRVPPEGRPWLEFAAVAGRGLDLAVLGWAMSQTEVEHWMTTCANAAVLEAQAGQWRFAHDKLREGLLRGLDAAHRRELHRQVALATEAVYLDPTAQAMNLAYHWGMAGEAAKECRYAAIAGEQAAARYANDDAMQYLARALELLGPDDVGWRLDRMIKLGEVRQLVGKWAEAEAIFRQALALADQAGGRRAQAQCQQNLGSLMLEKGAYAEALAWLESAQRHWEAVGDRVGLSTTLGLIGNVRWNQGQHQAALTFLVTTQPPCPAIEIAATTTKPAYAG